MKKGPIALLAMGFAATITLHAMAQENGWQVSQQTDRFVNRSIMAASTAADSGPGRMSLYCDTDTGFRIIIEPKKAVMVEGPGYVVFKIDGGREITLSADAYGDDDTDFVVVLGTDKVEPALATAKHVAVHFVGYNSSGDASFTFNDLAARKDMLLKLCPLGRSGPPSRL